MQNFKNEKNTLRKMVNQRYETKISVAIHRHDWKLVKTLIMTKVFQTFFETTPKIFKQTSNNGATFDFIASIVKSINVYSMLDA